MKGLITLFILGVVVAVKAEASNRTCPNDSEDPEDDVLIPHESDCSKFYKCSHGVKVLQDCPNGLHFNDETHECDWPNNANCEDSNSGGGSNSDENGDENENSCPSVIEDPEEDILLSHESDCTKFYKCTHGVKSLQDCPEGLYYNPEMRYCDWPHNTNCTNNSTNTNNTNNSTLTPANHPQNLFPHESDCSKFYIIFNEVQFEYNCPSGLYFNKNLGVCDYKSNVKCTNEPSNNDELSKIINNRIAKRNK